MKWTVNILWFLYGILLTLYCVNFYMLHQQRSFYKSIMEEQSKIVPGQWVQKQKCWPQDGKKHLDEQYDFYGEKLKDYPWPWVVGDSKGDERSPKVIGNCVTYWERIK